jgi:hypothetical protein
LPGGFRNGKIRGFISDAEEMGLVLDGKGLDAINDFNRQMYRLGLQFDAIKVALGQALLPILSAVVGWLNKASGAIKSFGNALQAPLSIVKAVIDRLREFADQVKANGFFAALIKLAEDVITGIGKVLGNVASWVIENLPKWRDAIFQLWSGLISWLRDTGWPAFVTFMETQVPKFGKWILDSIPEWANNLGILLKSVTTWFIGEFVPGMFQAAMTVIPKLAEWLLNLGLWFGNDAVPALWNAAVTLGEAIRDGVIAGPAKIKDKIIEAIQPGLTWITDRISDLLKELERIKRALEGGGAPLQNPNIPGGNIIKPSRGVMAAEGGIFPRAARRHSRNDR